ncbi:hypothetical protein LCGC14_3110930 [marine sediment metagenome]|uniref:Uncharacterized protein n=1 Tax=marine sediment metagenome TaxID=412755 RepID=A0A0F8WTY6_9ZZZZ
MMNEADDKALTPVSKGYAELQEVWDIDTSDLHGHQIQELDHQIAFLTAYAKCGTVLYAAEAAGVHEATAHNWKKVNHFRFKERMSMAHTSFSESLENKALELAMKLEPNNNPVILITLMNANNPDKYRPNSVAPSETMTETLQAMKQATREFKRLEDGTQTETVTETVIIKKGLQQPRTEE